MVSERVSAGPAGLNRTECQISTPSRTWLLSAGPAGLESASENLTQALIVFADKIPRVATTPGLELANAFSVYSAP
jgi:hypothetical protein